MRRPSFAGRTASLARHRHAAGDASVTLKLACPRLSKKSSESPADNSSQCLGFDQENSIPISRGGAPANLRIGGESTFSAILQPEHSEKCGHDKLSPEHCSLSSDRLEISSSCLLARRAVLLRVLPVSLPLPSCWKRLPCMLFELRLNPSTERRESNW